MDEDLADKLHAAPDTKLRSITVDYGQAIHPDKDTTIVEGVQVHLVYDEHDALRAAAVEHYLYD